MQSLRPLIWIPFLVIISSLKLLAQSAPEANLNYALSMYSTLMGNNITVDVTNRVLEEGEFQGATKKSLIENKRRFLVFNYPSDGLKIKSMISYVDKPGTRPLILWLRSGSRLQDIPVFHDAHLTKDLLLSTEATIVLINYRDGMSPGVDEYGGSDVADVNNIYQYLPQLYHKLGLEFPKEHRFMIGIGRGSMQMFLAMARYPALQVEFEKIVSICGILHIDLFAERNPDWLEKMKNSYCCKGKEWLNQRNPFLAIDHLSRKKLPILIIQGTDDLKISLGEGILFSEKLRGHGFTHVSYWEVGGGNHGLKNHPEWMRLIRYWLALPER
jgi:hypothetical protein